MLINPRNINRFLMLKLPSAWLCGVRVKSITKDACEVSARHKWINQNPFGSLYFAVQMMAAELSTGALLQFYIKKNQKEISMLVTAAKSVYLKKATGRITFTCTEGNLISMAIEKAISSGEGVAIVLKAFGKNEAGERVSEMEFEWSIRRR